MKNKAAKKNVHNFRRPGWHSGWPVVVEALEGLRPISPQWSVPNFASWPHSSASPNKRPSINWWARREPAISHVQINLPHFGMDIHKSADWNSFACDNEKQFGSSRSRKLAFSRTKVPGVNRLQNKLWFGWANSASAVHPKSGEESRAEQASVYGTFDVKWRTDFQQKSAYFRCIDCWAQEFFCD